MYYIYSSACLHIIIPMYISIEAIQILSRISITNIMNPSCHIIRTRHFHLPADKVPTMPLPSMATDALPWQHPQSSWYHIPMLFHLCLLETNDILPSLLTPPWWVETCICAFGFFTLYMFPINSITRKPSLCTFYFKEFFCTSLPQAGAIIGTLPSWSSPPLSGRDTLLKMFSENDFSLMKDFYKNLLQFNEIFAFPLWHVQKSTDNKEPAPMMK